MAGTDGGNFDWSEEEYRQDEELYYLLFNKDYENLERRFGSYLDSYAAGKITAETLSHRFDRFRRALGLGLQFNEWISAYPKSYAARLARGIFRTASAWELRGSKYASETSDNQFQQFRDEIKKAQSDVEFSLSLFSRPIESYCYLIRISKSLSLGKERELLDAAIRIDPYAYYPRAEYLGSIIPKWGGSKSLMSEFIDASKKSQLDAKLMSRLESLYYYHLAEQASRDREYRVSSDYYLKSYRINGTPSVLKDSAKAAKDGGLAELAFSLYDELARKHPKYEHGFSNRGYLYEVYFKDYDKAVNDYLIASDLGDSWAQNRMGWLYMTGTHVKTDLVKAEKYLLMAVAQNNKTARENLDILNNLKKKTSP